jgi:hypothetical protein
MKAHFYERLKAFGMRSRQALFISFYSEYNYQDGFGMLSL